MTSSYGKGADECPKAPAWRPEGVAPRSQDDNLVAYVLEGESWWHMDDACKSNEWCKRCWEQLTGTKHCCLDRPITILGTSIVCIIWSKGNTVTHCFAEDKGTLYFQADENLLFAEK